VRIYSHALQHAQSVRINSHLQQHHSATEQQASAHARQEADYLALSLELDVPEIALR